MATKEHETLTVRMEVTSASGGVAKFLDSSIPDDLYREGFFRSKRFSRYSDGEVLEVTFRVSSQMRHLLHIKVADSTDVGELTPKGEAANLGLPEGEWINGIYFTPEFLEVFTAADAIAAAVGAVNLRLVGSSGYGKTSIARAFAEQTGRSFLRMDCALIRDPEEWFGFREARDGSTVFIPTAFTELVTEGNAVILLDEANRLEPWLSNSLFPLLDDGRETHVHDEPITVGHNTVFIMTVNEGYQYVGTFEMDMALKNRIDMHLEAGPLPAAVEQQLLVDRCGIADEQAQQIVDVIVRLRNNDAVQTLDVDVTTRSSIKIAQAVAAGLPLRKAVEYTVIKSVPSESRKGLIDVVNAMLGMISFHDSVRSLLANAGAETSNVRLRVTAQPEEKITAIKKIRALTDWGLRETKEFVEGALSMPLNRELAKTIVEAVVSCGGVAVVASIVP